MYELKKNGKVFTSKFVGTAPSSYEKKKLPGRGLSKVEKHCYRRLQESVGNGFVGGISLVCRTNYALC